MMVDLHDDAAGRPGRASAGDTLTDMPLAWRWTLATLSVAAGAIHLAMAPSHLGESAVEEQGSSSPPGYSSALPLPS
jgi:hypothetical protein